jgi:hypothetical protein
MKLTQKQSSLISFGLLAIAVGFLAFFQLRSAPVAPPLPKREPMPIVSTEVPEQKTITSAPVAKPEKEALLSGTIIIGAKRLELSFVKGTSLYDVLVDQQKQNKILMEGKNFENLGFFVSRLDDLRDGDNNKHLVYYINGQSASTGISSYILQDKDTILWKLN